MREAWIETFVEQFPTQLAHAARSGLFDARRSEAAHAALTARLETLRRASDPLDILVLDDHRQAVLQSFGIEDEFRGVKDAATEMAHARLADWLETIDAAEPGEARTTQLVRGLLAGNLFDMGTAATSREFDDGVPTFEACLARVPDRPWGWDDVGPLARLIARPPSEAMILVDNAGPDAVLGALPLARAFVAHGARVVLAANERPALNDVTAAELARSCVRAAAVDAVFGGPDIEVASTGNGAPLIDLSALDPAFVDRTRTVGAIVILGMGRAVESNWNARFSVPCVRIAMLKDPLVATSVGGRTMDAICRVDGVGDRAAMPG